MIYRKVYDYRNASYYFPWILEIRQWKRALYAGYRTVFTQYVTTVQRRFSIGGAEYGGNLVKKLCIKHLKD